MQAPYTYPPALPDVSKRFSGRRTGALLVGIGIAAAGCGTALWLVATAPLLAFLLVTLPAWFLGGIALLAGIAGLEARIEFDHSGLSMAAPGWRGSPWPPVRRLRAPWGSIKAVRQRTEVYHLLPGRGLPLTVETYAIETENDRIVFAGKSIPHLSRAVGEIALRSGCPIRQEPAVNASILRSLFSGPPRW